MTDPSHPPDPQPDDSSQHMRLVPGEPLDAGLRRMALEQLEIAAEGFCLPTDDAELAELQTMLDDLKRDSSRRKG